MFVRVGVTGSSGLVGSGLVDALEQAGDEPVPLVRSRAQAADGGILWDPSSGTVEAERLESLDAVVHLAGEPIDQRWTRRVKERILDSRVQGTRLLVDALVGLEDPPQVLVSASAMGYYGDRGDEVLDESSAPGGLWVSEVCRRWEEATGPAAQAGIRVVHLRSGLVLSPHGGALAQMLLPFKLGLGGPVGSGQQWYSWLARDDAVGIVRHALEDEELEGPINACTPEPVRNRTFTKALGRVLGRPTVLPIPGFGLRMLYGQMADELLLASTRMEPAKVEKAGYAFKHAELEPALRHVLGRA